MLIAFGVVSLHRLNGAALKGRMTIRRWPLSKPSGSKITFVAHLLRGGLEVAVGAGEAVDPDLRLADQLRVVFVP